MISSISIEVSSRCDVEKVSRVYSELGVELVFVTWRPDAAIRQFCNTCVKLTEAGVGVVPHIVARNLNSRSELQQLLKQFNKCSGINSLMLLGGDALNAAGPYCSAIDLLADENIQSAGISKIFVAGYPKGHALISDQTLDASLLQKVSSTRLLNFGLEIVAQLCPSMADAVNWASETKARHDTEVRISVPLGNKNIIERRLTQIYQHPIEVKNLNNHDPQALAFLGSALKNLQAENIQAKLHLIPFHNMDSLLSYTNEINTMIKSEL